MRQHQKTVIYEYMVNNLFWHSTKQIATACHLHPRQALRLLNELEAHGILQHRRRYGRSSQPAGWRASLIHGGIFKCAISIYRRTRTPVPTTTIANHLGYEPAYIRYHLRPLEASNLLVRVAQRGGWLPQRHSHPARHKIAEHLPRIPTQTSQIAAQLGISPAYARHLLIQYEKIGLIRRTSPRGKWIA